jgi:simple sugar transport system permease protein
MNASALVRRWGPSVGLVAGALLVSAVVVLAAGRDPRIALLAVLDGAFGSLYGFLTVWTKTVPLLLTGLAVLVAFRAGFWNIGAEGQFVVGAIVAGWIGTLEGWPRVVHLPVIFAGAFAGGAGWCLIAAWLKVRRGAFEVISTIMLNFVALFVLSWLVHGPLQQASRAQPIGDPIVASAELPRLFGAAYPLHAGIVLGLVTLGLAAYLLDRTETGFRMKQVGRNPRAAAWAGIPVARTIYAAAAISGGLAALGGAAEVLGVLGRLFDKVSPGYGFTGIAVALLARLRPWALVPAALFFGVLEAGSSRLQQDADVSYVLVLVIQGVVILASIATGVAVGRRGSD